MVRTLLVWKFGREKSFRLEIFECCYPLVVVPVPVGHDAFVGLFHAASVNVNLPAQVICNVVRQHAHVFDIEVSARHVVAVLVPALHPFPKLVGESIAAWTCWEIVELGRPGELSHLCATLVLGIETAP